MYRDWTTEINAKLDTTAFSLPNSATWDDTYNTVNSNSATWNEVNEYTAGQNINITYNVISSKDFKAWLLKSLLEADDTEEVK